MAGCLANPIPNTGEALATSTSFEVGRAMVVRDLGVLRRVRRALGNGSAFGHTGSEVTYVVGHPIDVCLVTEAAPRTPQNGQLTELGKSACIAENLHCLIELSLLAKYLLVVHV